VLLLFVLTTRKWSINPFTNPNPVYSHSILRDNVKAMIVSELRIGKHAEGSRRGLIYGTVLSRHIYGGREEKYENPQLG
jgi:hypothetical protein